jgi:type IV secretory pathway VirB4 component
MARPLRDIDDQVQRSWRAEWLKTTILRPTGVEIHPAVTAYLDTGLDKLAAMSASQRTMTELWFALKAQSNRVNVAQTKRPEWQEKILALHLQVLQAIEPFTQRGQFGHILDADHDDFADGPIQTFEQETLLTMPRLVGPVMSYVFHGLEERFDTSHPTLLLMDDAAVTWVLPDYEEKGKEWIVTKAKKGVSMGFFTHSLVQVLSSTLGSLLLESCPTRFILPNPAARPPQLAEIYHRMGLNEEELRLISTARPQRECYYTVEQLGKRLLSLHLSPLILAMIGRNRAEDHQRMDEILQREGRGGFAAAWLRAQGFPEAAAQIEEEWSHVDATVDTDVAD